MSAYLFYSRVAMMAVMGVIFHILPRLARRELCFAVTVPADFRDSGPGRRILAAYRLQVWLHTAGAAALVWAAWVSGWTDVLPLAVLWPFIGFLAAFLMARRRVRPHGVSPDTMREAEVAPRAIGWPGGWIGQLGPFALLALVGVVMLIRRESLPELLPAHWGIDGQPDRWIEKSVSAVVGRLAAIAVLCASIPAFGYGILRYSRRIRVGEPVRPKAPFGDGGFGWTGSGSATRSTSATTRSGSCWPPSWDCPCC